MKKAFAILVALTMLLVLAGCTTPVANVKTEAPATPAPTVEPTPTPAPTEAPAVEKTITTGAFEGVAYTNDYFGMTFSVPDAWTVATKEQMQQIFKAGAELIGSDNKELEKTLKLADQRSLYLAYAAKFPLDYTEGGNPNINIVCENLTVAGAGNFTSKDYTDATIATLKQSIKGCTASDPTAMTIGVADVFVYDLSWTMNGVDIKQAQLCTVRNGYGIVITMTYFSDDQMAELQQIVNTINFK